MKEFQKPRTTVLVPRQVKPNLVEVRLGVLAEKVDPYTVSALCRDILTMTNTAGPNVKLVVSSPDHSQLKEKLGSLDVEFVPTDLATTNWIGYYNSKKPPIPEGVRSAILWKRIGPQVKLNVKLFSKGRQYSMPLNIKPVQFVPPTSSPTGMVMPPLMPDSPSPVGSIYPWQV